MTELTGGHRNRADHNSDAAGGAGQIESVSPSGSARPDQIPEPAGQRTRVNHSCSAGRVGGGGDKAALADQIIELWRERQDHQQAEKRLHLQLLSRCRRMTAGDKVAAKVLHGAMIKAWRGKAADPDAQAAAMLNRHLLEAYDLIAKARRALESELAARARDLPIAGTVALIPGFGTLGLCAIVGEAGDLGGYANPAKLWKRMGLAVMADGSRQRRVRGAAAFEHGYAPRRRSVMWTLGVALWKAKGPYRDLYLERKAFEGAKAEAAGLAVVPAAAIPKDNPSAFMSKGHIHNRAQRYVEKRLLRDLWRAWRREARKRTPTDFLLPPGANPREPEIAQAAQ